MAEQSEIKYESKEDEQLNVEKLFKAFMEDRKEKEENAVKTKFFPTPSPLALPTSYSKSGLEINPVSRKIGDLESTKVILFKHERGDDLILLPRRKRVTRSSKQLILNFQRTTSATSSQVQMQLPLMLPPTLSLGKPI